MDRIDHSVSIPPMASPTVWLATPEGITLIDTIAVDRAIRGERSGWTLTPDEAHFAAALMLDQAIPYSVVSVRVGVGPAKLRTWFPEAGPHCESAARPGPRKVPECGTTSGYRAHRSRGETPCAECKAERAAADRRYKLTGSSLALAG